MAWTDYLPSWATVEGNGVAVEADIVYPKILGKLAELDPDFNCEPTQEALTLARYIFTRYLKKIMYDNGGTPPMHLHIVDKDRAWALKKFSASDLNITAKKKAIYKAFGVSVVKPEQTVSLD